MVAAAGGERPLRWLGLDLGRRRIGIALSDTLGITAQPLETWRRAKELAGDLTRLATLCRIHQVDGLVLGLPLDGTGEIGRRAQITLRFAERLKESLGLPVETWDERFSTVAVERVLLDADLSRRRRKQVVDKLAAAYILQGFLDARARAAFERTRSAAPSVASPPADSEPSGPSSTHLQCDCGVPPEPSPTDDALRSARDESSPRTPLGAREAEGR